MRFQYIIWVTKNLTFFSEIATYCLSKQKIILNLNKYECETHKQNEIPEQTTTLHSNLTILSKQQLINSLTVLCILERRII